MVRGSWCSVAHSQTATLTGLLMKQLFPLLSDTWCGRSTGPFSCEFNAFLLSGSYRLHQVRFGAVKTYQAVLAAYKHEVG